MRLFRWVREVGGHGNYETFPVVGKGSARNYETFPAAGIVLGRGHGALPGIHGGSVGNYETFPAPPLWLKYETFPVPVLGQRHAYDGASCAGGIMRGRGSHQL